MARKISRPSHDSPTHSGRTLAERVKARVVEAGRALEDGSSKSNAPFGHLRPTRVTRKTATPSLGAEDPRESRSLRLVFGELRSTYRRYRRQTGKPAVPELREAVRAFQRGHSLGSLVAVATFLDDRNLLAW